REVLGDFTWLARVSDKGRAAAAETLHDYIYPCPMDRDVFERWGISSADFDRALQTHADDDAILAWASERVSADRRTAANEWLLRECTDNLDRQDREEGVVRR
ncbi:MAG: DUF5069 domain-containing protein, partial [Candidatus Eremiobacteraeota bacterium]|nr:DUF5069 domain-containing protein [Candidatus Eremiobacteraeota bacterium]